MRSVAFMSSSVVEYVRSANTMASVYCKAKPRANPAKEASMSFVVTITVATKMAKMAPTRFNRKPIQRLKSHRCQKVRAWSSILSNILSRTPDKSLLANYFVKRGSPVHICIRFVKSPNSTDS